MTNEQAVEQWLAGEFSEDWGGHALVLPRAIIKLSSGAALPVGKIPANVMALLEKLKRHEHGLETLLPVYAVNRPQEDLQLPPALPA